MFCSNKGWSDLLLQFIPFPYFSCFLLFFVSRGGGGSQISPSIVEPVGNDEEAFSKIDLEDGKRNKVIKATMFPSFHKISLVKASKTAEHVSCMYLVTKSSYRAKF